MNERIHDNEPDTSEPIVRALLAAECPQWATAPAHYLQTSGTDNAMWRLDLGSERDVVMRLPRRLDSAAGVEQEVAVLRRVEQLGVPTPSVRHVGAVSDVFPHRWSVLGWIDGTDAWIAKDELSSAMEANDLASDLATAVRSIGAVTDIAVQPRSPGGRGGPLGPLIDELHRWLDEPGAADRIDVGAVFRLTDQARELVDEPVTEGFVHGDLIPGNLLVAGGRLRAIIDWGGAGWGDPAQDLAPAWAVLDAEERLVFKEMVDVDEAAWIRGRTFELEHAIGGVLYYEPKRHVLGDIMARTLDRILAEAP